MRPLFRRIIGKILQIKAIFLTPIFPSTKYMPDIEIECLGSEYGRKYFASSSIGKNPILVSGGVGEDISFDIEFISKYGGLGFLFDPTPRAIWHMAEVNSCLGNPKNTQYSKNGKQISSSYNLETINSENLFFYRKALLDRPGIVKFYEPPVSEHVSYSIQNIQKRFRPKGSFIQVEAIGPIEVSQLVLGRKINILKLDIEGSEYEFLNSCFNNQIYPDQVLIEIDELHFPSIRSKKIAKKIFRLFSENNYSIAFRDVFNFTYIRN